MDNAKQTGPMGDHEKKPRPQRVIEHAEETEHGGMPPRKAADQGERGDADRGGEPPRPVTPPAEPGKQNRSHG